MEGVDEGAFAVYNEAADELEGPNYVVEERDEELDIYLHEDEVNFRIRS
jgi:hypothetical protein